MRLNLALIISIVIAVGLVAFGFTFYQISGERAKLNAELEARTAEIANEFSQNNLSFIGQNNQERFIDSISNKYHLLGIAIYYNNDSIIVNRAATLSFRFLLIILHSP